MRQWDSAGRRRWQAGEWPLRPWHPRPVPGDLALCPAEPYRSHAYLAGFGGALHRGQLAERAAPRWWLVRCDCRFAGRHVRIQVGASCERGVHQSRDRQRGESAAALNWLAAALLALLVAVSAAAAEQASDAEAHRLLAQGVNPFPIHLVRPPVAPLSAMAQLGRSIFDDASLSASGRMSCASCHDPAHHYGPPNGLPAMLGGAKLDQQGFRPTPTLTYL